MQSNCSVSCLLNVKIHGWQTCSVLTGMPHNVAIPQFSQMHTTAGKQTASLSAEPLFHVIPSTSFGVANQIAEEP